MLLCPNNRFRHGDPGFNEVGRTAERWPQAGRGRGKPLLSAGQKREGSRPVNDDNAKLQKLVASTVRAELDRQQGGKPAEKEKTD
jgi:hypothetical protein